jgi:thiol-disulfide isomerase/thioredoxin
MRFVGALCVLAALSGCAQGLGSNPGDGFVSGNGTITSLPASEREAPGEVTGETLDGEQISLADFKGKTVVVVVWGSWCAPCRAEAPMLAAAARDLADEGVVFLGIDSRDLNRAKAEAFVRTFALPYPSIYDPAGENLLAFRGTLSPNSVPSTVVIDEEGRVAGSVLGSIAKSTLYGLVEDAQEL